jgi:hypothetical protein
MAQTHEVEAQSLKTENIELFQQAIKSFETGEETYNHIRQIASNMEKIYVIYDQKEFIPGICSRIVREFGRLGHSKLERAVYHALDKAEFSRLKQEQYTGRKIQEEKDLPEEVSIEMKQMVESVAFAKKANLEKYPDWFVQRLQYGIHEVDRKLEAYEENNDILNLTKDYDSPLDDNEKSSPYYPKRPLQQPPKDDEPNCISKQYEYLVDDIKDFVENFLKHYYPTPKQRPYFAYAVKVTRKMFNQYPSDKIHRDYKEWAEIYAADIGIHPTGKSAKEISARYGEKIRRYDKQTGEPIYGRKGICKEQILKKRSSLTEFMKEVYYCWPLFMLTSHLYSMTKERRLVDHTIDMKPKRQHYS